MTKTCPYPKCNCPIDKNGICVRGLPEEDEIMQGVWTEWIENPGDGENPVPEWSESMEAIRRDGEEPIIVNNWEDTGEHWCITHYRYAVPADLAWLAENEIEYPQWGYTKSQWLRARRDLGYGQITGADSQIFGAGQQIPGANKQKRYRDHNGSDWIDEFARTATPEEFRGAMRFTIGKYLRRAGKKDELIKEIRKMRDYCDRWLEYEGDGEA